MEPLIDELEELSSKEDAEGEPEGVVWVMLRKQPKSETDPKKKR